MLHLDILSTKISGTKDNNVDASICVSSQILNIFQYRTAVLSGHKRPDTSVTNTFTKGDKTSITRDGYVNNAFKISVKCMEIKL